MFFFKYLEHFSKLIKKVKILSITYLARNLFSEWGKNSRLGENAKLVNPGLISVGCGVSIGSDIWLNAKDDGGEGRVTLVIGNHVRIGRQVQINAWKSVIICNDVLISDRVFISDADHNYESYSMPISKQGDRFVGSVLLKDGCWIGIGAVLMPGVTIGLNSIVSPNSVVTRDVPDYAVAAGIPAVIINKKLTKK